MADSSYCSGWGRAGPDEARERPALPAWISAPQSLASPRPPPPPPTRGLSPTNSEGDEKEELPQESAGEKLNNDITVGIRSANIIMASV